MGAKKQDWAEFAEHNKAEYYARGQRSFVYRLKYKGKEAIAKAERKDINAVCRALNEAKWLRILNTKGIGPKLLLEGSDFLVIKFVEGKRILEFAEKAEKEELRNALLDAMMQCRLLDELKVSKEEMHNPWKHIIVGKKTIMIDFEKCHYDINPKNVTQFSQFLMSKKPYALLKSKGLGFEKERAISLLKQYRRSKNVFAALLKAVSLKP